MDISVLNSKKELKIDISNYFGEADFITVRYIPRDIWNYINKLTVKTEDGILYQKMQVVSGKDAEEKYTNAMQKITSAEMEKGRECSLIVNRLLVEHGLDSEKHSFNDSGKQIRLDLNILSAIGGQTFEGMDFFNFVMNEIRSFNNNFDLGEQRGS